MKFSTLPKTHTIHQSISLQSLSLFLPQNKIAHKTNKQNKFTQTNPSIYYTQSTIERERERKRERDWSEID
jgi:hypothetical protein